MDLPNTSAALPRSVPARTAPSLGGHGDDGRRRRARRLAAGLCLALLGVEAASWAAWLARQAGGGPVRVPAVQPAHRAPGLPGRW